MLRARIRTSATVCGLLALGTLYLFPATTSATVQVAGRAGALAGTGLRSSEIGRAHV